MSFVKSKEFIEYGDIVVVFCGFRTTSIMKVEKGGQTQMKFGAIKHDDLVRDRYRYGGKYQSAKGTCLLLAITPEMWSLNLPHRTQILYATDISMITSQLYLQPGCKVIEAGTGSGSLSHSIIRTIFPTGHLYTFDFHEERVKCATKEFKEHQLDTYVTCTHKDVCKEGFDLENCADAVFLDLPKPWEAISSAYSALKNAGRICCFSPCIEQVQKSVQALELLNFIDIQTIECLNRPLDFKKLTTKSLKLNGEDLQVQDHEDTSILDIESKNDEDCLSDSNLMDCELDNETCKNNKSKSNSKVIITAAPISRMPGHTGFLTFATKF